MIEWQRLSELREDVGDEEFEDVVSLFLEEIRQTLPDLAQADLEARVSLLHSIKGSARNIGLTSFARVCDAEERNILETGRVSLSDADIMAAFERVDRLMAAGMSQFLAGDGVA